MRPATVRAIVDTLATCPNVAYDLRTLARHETCSVATSFYAKHPPDGFVSGPSVGRLRDLGLAEGGYGAWRITPLGREVVAALPDPHAEPEVVAGKVRHERNCQCAWCRNRRK